MFEAAGIREWRGHKVVDARHHSVGQLEAVYAGTRYGRGSSPWCGNTAARVAMMARSTWSAGS